MSFATLTIDINARLAGLEKDLGKVAHLAEQSSRRMSSAFRSMNSAFQLLAGGVVGGAFAAWIKGSINLQDELDALSRKTGISTKDLAGLKFAADQNSTSLELVARAAKELSVNMTDTPEKFARLGITAKDTTGALVQIADIVEQMPDGMQKTALLAELMGKKVGPELAEFLSQGGNALRGFITKGEGIYKVTKDNAVRAKEFNDQLAEIRARAQAAGIAIANDLLPGLNDTATAMNRLAEEGHPVLALWRGLAGMGKVAWDLLIPPEDLKESLKSANRLKELQSELTGIEAYLKRTGGRGDGLIGKWLHGSPEELRRRAEILRNQIEAIKNNADKLDQALSGKGNKPKTIPKPVQDLLNAGQKNGLEILRSLERDFQNDLAKRKDALNAPLLSASERQLAESLRDVHKRAQDAREALEKQKVATEAGGREFNGYQSALDKVTAKEREQVQAIKDLQAAQDKLNQSFSFGAATALREYLDEVQNTANQSKELMVTSFKGMEDAIAKFYRTGSFNIEMLKNSILDMLAQIAAKKTLAGLIGFFGLGAGSATPAATPAANGVAFSGSGVMPFANGGIVNNPTLFRFASGGGFRTGLMGEAGPEAVMPLVRDSSGKLGVRAQGGGVNVTYAPVIQIDARTDQAEVQRLVERAVRQGNAELVDRLQRQGAL